MSLFNFTSITFNKNMESRGSDARGGLVGDRYNQNTLRYPIDLGSYDKGHYMVIHINEQIKTNYVGPASSDMPTIFQNKINLNNTVGGTGIGGVNNYLNGVSNIAQKFSNSDNIAGSIAKNILNLSGAVQNITTGPTQSTTTTDGSSYKPPLDVRTIRRTTDTIALYMPDTLNFVHSQSYNDIALGGGAFAAIGSAVAAVQGSKDAKDLADIAAKNVTPFTLYGLSRLAGDVGSAVFSGLFGAVANPSLEVLYSSPALRTFRFDFMFYPRSVKEADEVQSILDRLRFHQAPEILGNQVGGIGGFFMVPPSEFDIKFYYNGKENPNIPKISTCVLTTLDIDYAPNGFSAYEVPNVTSPVKGQTGMPVAIRLSLEFKETEMLTKANFAKEAKRYTRLEAQSNAERDL